MTRERKALLALGGLFLFAHILSAPDTFGDIDAVNFALGVREYDVAAHQPHPPGYPVYVAMAKASTALLEAVGVPAASVRGLSILNALAGTLAIPVLFVLFLSLVRDERTAAAGAILTAFAPLFWFTALRPLSDVTGFVVALVAQALLVLVVLNRDPAAGVGRALALGAFVTGMSIGVRSQNFTLTLPLLALALIIGGTGISWRDRLAALCALAVGTLLWSVPLVTLSGGIEGYLAALGDQAGEDFTGAAMLWTTRTARALVDALQYTFLWPWGSLVMGGIVTAAATAGAILMVLRNREALGVLIVAYAPYAAFQLTFQETVMTRYALPLLPPVGLMAAYALAAAGRMPLHAGVAAFIVAALVMVAGPSRTYARLGGPGARIMADAERMSEATAIGMHAVMRRFEEWYHTSGSREVIRARHGREVFALVDHWKNEPDAVVAFMANAARSDLAMLDPQSRTLRGSYDWGFPEMPLVGGARPSELQLFELRPPGWMLDQGWAVTAEVAGQSFRAGARPEVRPSIAWIRSREEGATLLIGGRHLQTGSAPARITLTLPDRTVERFEVSSGFFLRTIDLPPGTLRSLAAYLPLSVEAAPAATGDIRVSLEQFDVQGPGVPMLGFAGGWQEPEYSRQTGRAWRWMSARGNLWVRPVGRDVTLTIVAESPLRYFDAPPALRARIGDEVVNRLSPIADFEWEVRLPDALLAANQGQVVIESDKSFVPGAGRTGDQRQLALRVYSVGVN